MLHHQFTDGLFQVKSATPQQSGFPSQKHKMFARVRRRTNWQGVLVGTFITSGVLFVFTAYFVPKGRYDSEARSSELNLTKFTLEENDEEAESYDEIAEEYTAPPGGCHSRVCSQEERFQQLKNGCEAHPELREIYNEEDAQTYFRLLVDDKHKVLYCALPKAASTTFYNMFYYSVTGRHLEDIHCRPCWEKEGLIFMDRFPKPERDRRLKEYYKIMVVRHPMDRLISCWNGKFTSPHKHATWRHNGPRMIEMFRTIPTNSTLQQEIRKGASFPEFIQYVNYLEKNSPEVHNQHWNVHYRLCHPCSINYDLIVKVETMQQDSKFLLERLKLNGSEFPLINARRTTEEETLMLEKTLEEYRNVPPTDLAQIKRMYGYDIDLFGYDWDEEKLKASCGCNQNEGRCC